MDRSEIGSWLSGPRITTGLDGEVGHPGERLGLPPDGVGSVAGWGQRLGALAVDWATSIGVTLALIGSPQPGDDAFSVLVLAVFAVESVVLLTTASRTLGMLVFGAQVVAVDRDRPTILQILIRTLLLVLVIPAVIYDRDRRGLHDRAVRTVVLRTR